MTGSDQLLVNGCGWITSFLLSETAGTAGAHLDLYDGADETGQLIGSIYFSAYAAITSGRSPGQLGFRNSLWIDVESGSIAGAIGLKLCNTPQEWYAELERYEASQQQS